MCGLYGCITKKSHKLTAQQLEKRNAIIKSLAVAMQSRGTHSTGIAGINSQEYSYFKQAISADEFIQTEGVSKFLAKNYNIIIGHTRYATVGDINDTNAHPFEHGRIIGAHNGSVSNHSDIKDEHKAKFEVDSEAIFYLLDKYNNNYTKAFKELEGRFAITWFDKRQPNKLHIVLDGNPLTIVRVPELETYFYTSEKYALQAIIASHFNLKDKSFWTPHTEHVYEIDTNLGIKKKKVEFKEYVSSYHGGYYSGNYNWDKGKYDDDEARREIEQYYADEADKEAQRLIGDGKTYKERTGYDNPFKLNKDERAEWEKIMDLTTADMKKIKIQVEGDGCAYCNVLLDMDEGFYWHEIDKVAVCFACADELDMETKSMTYISPEDYYDITEELDEYEADVPPTN